MVLAAPVLLERETGKATQTSAYMRQTADEATKLGAKFSEWGETKRDELNVRSSIFCRHLPILWQKTESENLVLL